MVVDPMVWLASGYGTFLLLVAHLLDRMARRTSRQVSHWRSGAFVYREDHDAWICPEDQWLWPQSFDPDHRVMRYRASPTVCNSCPVKDTCTTSDSGREISRSVDPWPSSESERFHRGIACTVAVLGGLWPLGTVWVVDGWAGRGVLAVVVALIVLGAWPLFAHWRRSAANFPDQVPVKDLDEAVAERAVLAARNARRRPGYGSDRRRAVPVELRAPPAFHAGIDDAAPQSEHDRFATRWGSFTDADDLPDAGWSRRETT